MPEIASRWARNIYQTYQIDGQYRNYSCRTVVALPIGSGMSLRFESALAAVFGKQGCKVRMAHRHGGSQPLEIVRCHQISIFSPIYSQAPSRLPEPDVCIAPTRNYSLKSK
jgi:hypothetical protein